MADVRGAKRGDGGGAAGDSEGGRGVCAAGSGYPEERLRYMLEDSEAEVVLTEKGLRDQFEGMASAAEDSGSGSRGSG